MPQTDEQIAEFLNKLDTDDDFRAALINDPEPIFVEYNIPYDAALLLPQEDRELPPKGDICAKYDEHKNKIFPDNDFSNNDLQLNLTTSSN